MPAWLLPAISAGASIVGGLSGARGASRARRRQNQAYGRALTTAEDRYQSRSPFRDRALAALGDTGTDAMQYFDPSLYQQQDIGYNQSPFAQQARQRLGSADRVENVRGALDDFDRESEPVLASQFRNARQAAGATGQSAGSGRLTTSIGDYLINRDRERDSYRNDLLRDATDAQMEDLFRMNEIGTRESDSAYDRAVGERDRRTQLGREGLQDRLSILGSNRAERGSRLAEALGLAEFGYGDDDVIQILMQMAGMEGQNADRSSGAAGMNFSVLGEFLASLRNGGQSGGGRPPVIGQSGSQNRNV